MYDRFSVALHLVLLKWVIYTVSYIERVGISHIVAVFRVAVSSASLPPMVQLLIIIRHVPHRCGMPFRTTLGYHESDVVPGSSSFEAS